MLARSPNSAGALLIAAISGRALAAAARRAGYRPLVADFFRDTDTVAAAERVAVLPGNLRDGIDDEQVLPTLLQLAGSERPVAVALGSGFERRTALVDEIARHFPLVGNHGEAIRRVKDPQALASDCAALGIPHPQFQWELPPDPRNWVVKTAGAAGGTHVRRGTPLSPQRSTANVAPLTVSPSGRATSPPLSWGRGAQAGEASALQQRSPALGGEDGRPQTWRLSSTLTKWGRGGSPTAASPPRRDGEGVFDEAGSGRDESLVPSPSPYFQRFISGQSISALFVADGDGARIVGFSRQWSAPAPATPFRYGGAVRLRRVERRDAAMVGAWLSGLAGRAGLRGLCSADFIRNEEGWHLLEVNPRPGATLDIFDSLEAPLMEAHLRASRGEPYNLPRFADSMAAMIAYASEPIAHFPALAWPEWTADHQSSGTALMAGDPVCTVFARGRNAAATERAVRAQAIELQRAWEGDRQ